MEAGTTGWLPAQQHHGHNIGDTPTHVIFVELKGGKGLVDSEALGPDDVQVPIAAADETRHYPLYP